MEEAGTIFWPPAVTFGACLAFGKKRDHSYVLDTKSFCISRTGSYLLVQYIRVDKFKNLKVNLTKLFLDNFTFAFLKFSRLITYSKKLKRVQEIHEYQTAQNSSNLKILFHFPQDLYEMTLAG